MNKDKIRPHEIQIPLYPNNFMQIPVVISPVITPINDILVNALLTIRRCVDLYLLLINKRVGSFIPETRANNIKNKTYMFSILL